MLRYLALGDSYTVGEGVEPSRCWPRQLAAALRADGVPLAEPQIVATTGWTTDELDAGIDAAAPQGRFDLVSLLVGVNDQYRGRPLDDYRPRFSALLERAIAFAGARPSQVLVLAIPDWGVTPFAAAQGRDRARIAAELDAFNRAAADICAARGVTFVDIAPASRARGGEAAMLAADGLHPSAVMHALWTAQALPAARDALA